MSTLREPIYGTAARIVAHAPMIMAMINDALVSLNTRAEGDIPSPGRYLASVQYTDPVYLEARAKAAARGGTMPEILKPFVDDDTYTRGELIIALRAAMVEINMQVHALKETDPTSGENYDADVAEAAWMAELAVNRGQFQYGDRAEMRTHVEIDVHPVDLRLIAMIAYKASKTHNPETFPHVETESQAEIYAKFAAEPHRVIPKGLGAKTREMVGDMIEHLTSTVEQDIICFVGHTERLDINDGFTFNPSITIEYKAGTLHASLGHHKNDNITFISGREISLNMTFPASVLQTKIGGPLEQLVDHPLYNGLGLTIRNIVEQDGETIVIIDNPRPNPVEIRDIISALANGYEASFVPSDLDWDQDLNGDHDASAGDYDGDFGGDDEDD